MERQEIFDKIATVLATDFEIDRSRLVPEAKLFEDLDLDSIDAVDLVVRLQQETGIKVKAEDFRAIRTLGDVVEVVARLVSEQRG